MQIQIPPFRLYGLIGCPHCVEAEQFFREQQVPVLVIVGNDDPIAEAGIKALTGKEEASYPMLVCTFGKQIVEGYKGDEYKRLVDAYRVLFNSPSPSNAASSGQQPNGPLEAPATEAIAGAN